MRKGYQYIAPMPAVRQNVLTPWEQIAAVLDQNNVPIKETSIEVRIGIDVDGETEALRVRATWTE